MHTFYGIAGGVTIILLCIAAAGAGIGYALERLRARCERRDEQTAELTRRRLGQRIAMDARWLTEDVGAWKVLQVLGKDLVEDGSYDIDRVRDRWRQAMKAETRAPGQ